MNNNFNSILTQQKLLNINPRMSNDPSVTSLDPSDFPNLHSQNNSFNLQQMQQIQNQLRNSSFQSGTVSAPILDSQKNLWFHLSNSIPGNNYNNDTTSNMLMLMKKSNNNLLNGTNYLFQRQNSFNQSSKLWGNLNSSVDYNFKDSITNIQNSHQEFQIQQEDFPALPGPQSVQSKSDSITNLSTNTDLKSSNTNLEDANLISPNGLVNSSSGTNVSTKALNVNQNVTNTSQTVQNSQQPGKKGIIILPDGRIKNVPPNMLLDQFGIVGLLAYLRSADREKDIYTLALGTDLTALGLNLNLNENLYHSFLSPFSDASCRLQDIDFPVPIEYKINFQIKDKLAPIDLSRYHEDTLFYLFYMNGGDLIQLRAAAALFDHDWRYHTEKRIWLTKVPGLEPHQKEAKFERGIYTVFDVSQWRKVQMEMSIEYNKLAEKPQLGQFLLPQQQQDQEFLSSSYKNNFKSF